MNTEISSDPAPMATVNLIEKWKTDHKKHRKRPGSGEWTFGRSE
ncbi:hypothetical protein [Sedimenticola thiotaurini]|nr:hypothetical protein [Sedimenticola thiotaurini]